MSQKKSEKLLSSDKHLSTMMKLALPVMVSGLVMAFYNVVDSLFVGRYVGDNALAALAVNNTIQVSLIAISSLFAVGVSSIISRSLGAGQQEKTREVLISGLGFSFLATFSFAWALLFNLDKVLLWIGSPPEVLSYSRQYAGIILWFAFIAPMNDVLNATLRASGLSHWTMALMLISGVSNIILDALFIIVFGWGVSGAAVATVIAQCIAFIAAFIIVQKIYQVSLTPRSVLKKLNPRILVEIVRIGFPTMIKSSLFTIMNLTANRALVRFGADAIASFGVIYKVVHLAYQPIFGFNLGVQPYIGYNYGAKSYSKVIKIIRTASITAIILGMVPTTFFLIAPESFFRMFSTSDIIIQHIRNCSIAMGVTFFLYGYQVVSAGSSLAMGHARLSLLSTCFRPASMVLFMAFLPKFFSLWGVWIAFPLTDIVSTFFIAWIMRNEFKYLQKKESELSYAK